MRRNILFATIFFCSLSASIINNYNSIYYLSKNPKSNSLGGIHTLSNNISGVFYQPLSRKNIKGDSYFSYLSQFDNSINRTVSDILLEYQAVRHSSVCLFQSFTEDMLSKSGMANGKLLSVKGIGKIIAGHEKHHINVLTEKYLNQ